MRPVVTSDGIRACDRIAGRSVPKIVLMENAGRAVAELAVALAAKVPANGSIEARAARAAGGDGVSITVICGKGNNGGDGFVAARHLASARGVGRVGVVLSGSERELRAETRLNFRALKASGVRIVRSPAALPRPDIVIDALFGTGRPRAGEDGRRSRRGHRKSSNRRAASLIDWINKCGATVIAVDIPSGLDPDDGLARGRAVKADHTVTMGLMKTGLLLEDGPDHSGSVSVAELGLAFDRLPGTYINQFQVDRCPPLPQRPRTAHKYSVGKVLVIAGSVGYTGAAALTAGAALRSGAGAVILAAPQETCPVLARKLTEVIVKPVPSAAGTMLRSAIEQLERELEWADVLVMGPGLGRTDDVAALVGRVLGGRPRNLLLDADALRVLAAQPELLKLVKRHQVILTPHEGEYLALSGLAKDNRSDRLLLSRAFAVKQGAIVVLKGAPTITVFPDARAYFNATGNPGMATAGAGDVLAGLIGGLWAQYVANGSDEAAEAAALSGVYLHGYAGDRALSRLGMSLLATDILHELPEAMAGAGSPGMA